ncbi:MAG: Eco57I restriction-modification methylase domain-containing protein [Thermomicrobiales bacterium]
MTLDTTHRRHLLQHVQFKELFNDLGWDNFNNPPHVIERDDQTFILAPIAQKRGVQIFECSPGPDGQIPLYPLRRKIERELTKHAFEHLIIFVDEERATQVWQWVKRESGKPATCREHTYLTSQSGTPLLQKLEGIRFTLNEEEELTITAVTERLQKELDRDRVTKKFYDRFQKELGRFLDFIEGITGHVEDQKWYASVMLNRLMFVYFIQKQGFLDGGDTKYLTNRLARVRQERGDDQFHTFYRAFLRRLFHGLNTPDADRDPDLERLIGRVPYLNGGLFDVHELEQRYRSIEIPDEAFDNLFAFFDAYTWHLDDRPLRDDTEINPDVLGYIFEKYVNQKQMGAYYTKEDITGYIAKNTIVPFILDKAKAGSAVAFRPDGYVWRLLQDNPDRYLYDAVKKGVDLTIPPAIAAGLDDVAQRGGWNRPADPDYALPTETWREYVARRQRYEEVWTKLVDGEVTDVNDLITLNLNIVQFAEDVIDSCEGRDLLAALYDAISTVTVLDPTCGSGAFLFAALTILEPLYEACLDRMQAFIDEPDPSSGELPSQARYRDFREILAQVEKHPNRTYFILKSIILNNLYGVDIMEEAVEICKLRLFLKLVSQLQPGQPIEPLPDIDFNIRAGNTLVGFAKLDEVERAIKQTDDGRLRMLEVLDEERSALTRIQEAAEIADRAFQMFHRMQTEQGMEAASFLEAKHDLRGRLKSLRDELDGYLAADYGIAVRSGQASLGFDQWRESHQPFHWFVEFYGIMRGGGFDVVLGNPPYVEWAKIRDYRVLNGQYATRACGNIYATVCERSYQLMNRTGRFGMIVPLSCVATERMAPLRRLWNSQNLSTCVSHYSGDAHPSVLFEGVKFRLSILLQGKGKGSSDLFSTHFQRWLPDGRAWLFPMISYTKVAPRFLRLGLLPKIASGTHAAILRKLCLLDECLAKDIAGNLPCEVYAHRIIAHFVKALDFVPYFASERDGQKKSEDYKVFPVRTPCQRDTLSAVLNSSLFYSWFVTFSDVYHCGRDLILDFPCSVPGLAQNHGQELSSITRRLMENLMANSVRRRIPYKATGIVEYDEFYPRLSKSIIDEIDRVLAKHYGLTDEELDFIINYDVKYRMGRDAEAEAEGA